MHKRHRRRRLPGVRRAGRRHSSSRSRTRSRRATVRHRLRSRARRRARQSNRQRTINQWHLRRRKHQQASGRAGCIECDNNVVERRGLHSATRAIRQHPGALALATHAGFARRSARAGLSAHGRRALQGTRRRYVRSRTESSRRKIRGSIRSCWRPCTAGASSPPWKTAIRLKAIRTCGCTSP